MDEAQRKSVVAAMDAFPHGWCFEEKAVAMAEAILEHRPAVAVEIGVFGGRSLAAIATALRLAGNGGHVWGVDPFTVADAIEDVAEPENVAWAKTCDYEAVYRTCMDGLFATGLSPTATVLRLTSERAAPLFREGVDFLHVDGNHSEPASCRDVALWLPLVRAGGVVVMDDVDWPSVGKAVAAVEARCDAFFDHHDAKGRSFRMYRKRP